jgi:hypothetical protein
MPCQQPPHIHAGNRYRLIAAKHAEGSTDQAVISERIHQLTDARDLTLTRPSLAQSSLACDNTALGVHTIQTLSVNQSRSCPAATPGMPSIHPSTVAARDLTSHWLSAAALPRWAK